jgi:5-methylcytosine-specific restriction endonuclease McrA
MGKVCTKCFIEKPATTEFFHKLGDGLRPDCKGCRGKGKAVVYEFPASKVCTRCGCEHMATSEFFHVASKGKYGISAICKSCAAGYNKQNKIRIAANFTRWYKNGGRETVLANNAARRVRELGAKGSHTPQQWEARCEYYGNKCVDCGSPDITKDHRVPLSKGGTDWASNLIPRCKSCNSRKRDWWVG